MLAGLIARGATLGRERARAAAGRLAKDMADAAPGDVRIAAGEDGVTLSGRGLRRRMITDARLRWLTEQVR